MNCNYKPMQNNCKMYETGEKTYSKCTSDASFSQQKVSWNVANQSQKSCHTSWIKRSCTAWNHEGLAEPKQETSQNTRKNNKPSRFHLRCLAFFAKIDNGSVGILRQRESAV